MVAARLRRVGMVSMNSPLMRFGDGLAEAPVTIW